MTTLREYMESGGTITVHCTNLHPQPCIYWQKLDLRSLVQRVGWDFDIYEQQGQLRQMFVCSKCGHRGVSFTMGHEDAERSSGIGAGGHYVPDKSDEVSYEEALRKDIEFRRMAAERDRINGSLPWVGKRRSSRRRRRSRG